jgi:biotin-[acetyl-CoA-carboxylase] ligase BirA-like protein
MIIFTDDKEGAEKAFTVHQEWKSADYSTIDKNLGILMERLYRDKPVHRSESRISERWPYAFFVNNAPSSHFDLLLEWSQEHSELPDGILCVAGSGHQFHGQRERPWVAQEGNIHLSIYLSPGKKISQYHSGLPVLSAVSLVQAIDAIEDLEERAQIKWVNDVLIQGAKVAGFLVHTHTVQDKVVGIILGIGLNVEKTPVLGHDLFVPEAGSLWDFLPSPPFVTRKKVLEHLLEALEKNYGLLLEGWYPKLLDFYRRRSIVIGREVQVFSHIPNAKQTLIASGTVEQIGENLELWLVGQKNPVTEGRLVLVPENRADSI